MRNMKGHGLQNQLCSSSPVETEGNLNPAQMATPKEVLFGTLEDLGGEDFKVFKWYLQQQEIMETYPAIPTSRLEEADRVDTVNQMVKTYSINTIKVTSMVLMKMNKNNLVENLSQCTSEPADILAQCQQKVKGKLKNKFKDFIEKLTKTRNGKPFDEIYTDMYITMAETGEVNEEHEVRQVERTSLKQDKPETTTCNEIFKSTNDKGEPIRTVLTKGVAGIGKTVVTQKFSLDWAEDKANQDIGFIFPFTFRQLNVLKQKFSLMELVHHFFTETKDAGIWMFEDFQVVFIFDGLDECRPPLDFNNTQILTDVSESASVDVLLMNLIRGNLLPSARLWITTRPAAANQIPAQCVDMVTEVRGFTDPQKEEYFRKRFTDEEQASTIISHIKRSRSLHIMCHIPLFCWITSSVLQDMLNHKGEELPKTLTEMYIYFLVVQTKQKNIKYDGRSERDSHWSPENKKMIESLGELAFEQLKKGNLVFYESDLTECGIDVRSASVYSGVFTEIFKEERGLYEDKMFCFIHLSVQEFLSALHVHETFIKIGVNRLSEETQRSKLLRNKSKLQHLHQVAVNQALKSPNGHLDLFLRFLLGLSLESNQILLRGLLTQTGSCVESIQETVKYVKKKMKKNIFPEKNINLFHCLNELNDRSLEDQIQKYLNSGCLTTDKLSPAQWSALVFILMSSEKDLHIFDLKKYSASEEALLRLLPVVKASNETLLTGCNLSERSCEHLSSVLSSASSALRHLDLSNNDLKDSGVEILCSALKSPNCVLETLRLNSCGLTEGSCEALLPVLSSQSSALIELDLSNNDLRDSGVALVSCGLDSPHCSLAILRLTSCNLSERTCEALSSVLGSQSSSLTKLDLGLNNLNDSGVKTLCSALKSPSSKLEILSLSVCKLSKRSCEDLSSILGCPSSTLRQLDLSNNKLLDSGVKMLLRGLESPNCKLETLRLNGCKMSEGTCEGLSSVLSSQSSGLKEVDLRNNHLMDSGVELLCSGLKSDQCTVDVLSLTGCNLTETSCEALSSVLSSQSSVLTDLDLSNNDLTDSGVELLSAALTRPRCTLGILRLTRCSLSEKSCGALSVVLRSQSSRLKELDLSNNDLQDAGVKILSTALKSPLCALETLRLSGCLITEGGCASLASALKSNPSHLRELDLSYNHPGKLGVKLLSALLKDPLWKLDVLRLDHGGPHRLKPGLKKYFCELTVDINTANWHLKVSDNNRRVSRVEEKQPYPEHPDRFHWCQVLCCTGLTGRCYWEVERRGWVDVAVTYRRIRRKGRRPDAMLGGNRQSWCLFCSDYGYSVWHNNKQITLLDPSPSSSSSSPPSSTSSSPTSSPSSSPTFSPSSSPTSSASSLPPHRVAVYVDCPAGSLSFYRVSSDQRIHLHTFNTTFTEPLFVGFRFWSLFPGSSVFLCP